MNKQKNPRLMANRILLNTVVNQHSLTYITKQDNGSDKGFIMALCYGTLRFYFTLSWYLNQLLAKPLKTKDHDVLLLLLAGLYELNSMQTPAYAVITANVEAVRTLGKPWAASLVNAVLRNFIRQRESLQQQLAQESCRFDHPSWLVQRIQKAWPEHWQQIFTINNQQGPLILRVNRQKITRSNYLTELQSQEISAEIIPFNEQGIVLKEAIPVEKIPLFKQGFVTVQDTAAQFAANLLEINSSQRVLDACSAPGGKTTHILELQPNIELIALDIDGKRLQKTEENLKRLELNAYVEVGDAANPQQWWDKKPFDRILLDAPCSGTGVIRRHPDIKLLRKESDITKLTETQYGLLKKLWPLLKPGGLLLYCTCSILPEENEELIAHFLLEQTDAHALKTSEVPGFTLKYGCQLLPSENWDGFYYAKLKKLEPV